MGRPKGERRRIMQEEKEHKRINKLIRKTKAEKEEIMLKKCQK